MGLKGLSRAPRAPPRCPAGPPCPPLLFPRRNRAGAQRVAADAAVSPASPDRRRLEFLAAGLSSGHADLAGEPRVSRRSSWTFSPSLLMVEPPPESRPALSRHGHGSPRPLARPAWHMGHGPSSQLPWVILARVKKVPAPYFFPEFQKICKNLYKLVKCISIDLCVRKMRMLYQNVQKNELYLLMSISCIV
jgi:hypothetical protein